MTDHPGIPRLRSILASLYPDEASQRRVVSDIGLSETSCDFAGNAINVWHAILLEARRHEKIEVLISNVLSEFPNNSDLMAVARDFQVWMVPFLIAAMTQDEADSLFTERVFEDPNIQPSKKDLFRNFQSELVQHGLDNFLNYYAPTREEWRPCFSTDGSIQMIIQSAFNSLNEDPRLSRSQPSLIPEFLSASFFSTARTERNHTISLMDKFGGVLVVDAISMFHPWLSQSILNSGIVGRNHVAILVVSPIDANALPINRSIETVFDHNMERAYTRFVQLDQLCEIELGNLHSLKRWFFRAIPETVRLMRQNTPHPLKVDLMRQNLGNESRRGINRLFPGAGGIQ